MIIIESKGIRLLRTKKKIRLLCFYSNFVFISVAETKARSILECWQLCKNFTDKEMSRKRVYRSVQLSYVCWTDNNIAHVLVKFVFKSVSRSVWWDYFPTCVLVDASKDLIQWFIFLLKKIGHYLFWTHTLNCKIYKDKIKKKLKSLFAFHVNKWWSLERVKKLWQYLQD